MTSILPQKKHHDHECIQSFRLVFLELKKCVDMTGFCMQTKSHMMPRKPRGTQMCDLREPRFTPFQPIVGYFYQIYIHFYIRLKYLVTLQ